MTYALVYKTQLCDLENFFKEALKMGTDGAVGTNGGWLTCH